MDFPVSDFGAVENLGTYSDCYRSGSGAERGQEYIHLQSVLTDGSNHYGISALAFDPQEELLWIGNQGGRVTSYYSNMLQKYTSFQVQQSNEVCQVQALDAGLLSLTSSVLKLNTRKGLVAFTYNFPEGQDNLMCMVQISSGQQILVGGQQTQMLRMDLSRGEVVETVEIEGDCAFLCSHPRFICNADMSGKITLRDPNSLAPQCSINTHSAVLSDVDICGNLLVTCGFSNRHGSLAVDRFLILYDIRVMKAMPPMPVVFPPFQVRFVPAFSSRICVTSQGGQFQFLDTDNSSQQAASYIQQVDTGGTPLLTMGLSTSCQALAFGDSAGYLHLLGASDQIVFIPYQHPTEFPDPVETLNPIDIHDEVTPLASVPMPYCEGKLLSDWPKEFSKVVYRRPPTIDPQILNSIKMVGPIGYAPNPGNKRRNQVAYQFERKGRHKADNNSSNNDMVPVRYLRIEAKYSGGRGGMEEFDFNLYNSTSFAGLESSQPNAYCNNMIQVLYFIEPLRCSLLNHLCQREFCVSCELGFLFHMLDNAQGMPCLASNFLRAFRTIPEASALGLILPDLDEAKKKVNFPHLVQSWVRFMLQQIHMDTLDPGNNSNEDSNNEFPQNKSPVSQLFGAHLRSSNLCRCGNPTEQIATSLLCSMVYPDPGFSSKSPITFGQLLESSLSVEQCMPAWCDKCEKYQPMKQTKRLMTLPDVLIINCGFDNSQDIQFWKSQVDLANGGDGKKGTNLQEMVSCMLLRKPCRYSDNCTRLDCRFSHPRDKGKRNQILGPLTPVIQNQQTPTEPPPAQVGWVESWLPHEISMLLDRDTGTVCISEAPENGEKYELTSIIVVTRDTSSTGHDNIVTLVKVGPSSHENHQGAPASQWYLFNDFTILPVTKEEAVFLDFDWKFPCVLFFSRADINERHPLEVLNVLGQDVFCEDMSLAARGSRIPITFTPLGENEMPQITDIVAMDAEFVTLNQEEAEIRSDGTRSTIRPSQMSVARISCVRGQGPLEGIPFIDDYISTQEQVVDYLTKFSGIQPGDLDASISSKHLTTLKATYKKLLFLINTGVKFVGHGLKNDFRVINLVVPADQVIDTVFLFQLPNKRMISLRFLAWHFLGLKIQAETHDSIEDAKTALRLYRKYQSLEREGRVLDALKELYEKGRALQWKVPSLDED